jgi:ParB family chromosome partitioning protein
MSTAAASSPAPEDRRILRCPATHIDTSGAWLFWSSAPTPALIRSLERHGQLVPVLVDASGPAPVLIAGAARVAALAAAGRDVLCLDLGSLDEMARGLAHMQSNIGRELNDAQIVAAMRYFRSIPSADMPPVLESLGIEPRSKRLRLLDAWLTLPKKWDLLLDNVPMACAELLAGFPREELPGLEPLFNSLSWSRGNAVNLLTWLRETCLRDEIGAGALLEDCGMREILESGLSPKDVMTRIAFEVRRRRFPRLSALERDFAEAARKTSAGTRWRMVQPDQFESGAVDMTVRVKSPAELRAAAAELTIIAAREDLVSLFPAEGS